MIFSCFIQKLKENVGGLLGGGGAKGYVAPPPLKLLGGLAPPGPPPLVLRLWCSHYNRLIEVHTIYHFLIWIIWKRKSPLIIPSLQLWIFFNGPRNEFETAMENEPSVFEPRKFYCNVNELTDFIDCRRFSWNQTSLTVHMAVSVYLSMTARPVNVRR